MEQLFNNQSIYLLRRLGKEPKRLQLVQPEGLGNFVSCSNLIGQEPCDVSIWITWVHLLLTCEARIHQVDLPWHFRVSQVAHAHDSQRDPFFKMKIFPKSRQNETIFTNYDNLHKEKKSSSSYLTINLNFGKWSQNKQLSFWQEIFLAQKIVLVIFLALKRGSEYKIEILIERASKFCQQCRSASFEKSHAMRY